MKEAVSDEILGAYIDDELDPAERARLLDRMTTDATLGGRACELWRLKQMLRGAYPEPRTKSAPAGRHFSAPRWTQALAATLLLLIGSVSGWLANERLEDDRLLAREIETIGAEGGRVVLHLFSDEPARMETALRTAERLAKARDRNGKPLHVEFLANGPGLHLLRTGGSPYAARVAALSHYDNLRLVACREAMDRMRERGIDVVLLPGVNEARSAESELAERLTQGWRYLQS